MCFVVSFSLERGFGLFGLVQVRHRWKEAVEAEKIAKEEVEKAGLKREIFWVVFPWCPTGVPRRISTASSLNMVPEGSWF